MIGEDKRLSGNAFRPPIMGVIDFKTGRKDRTFRGCTQKEVQCVLFGALEPILFVERPGVDAND